MIPFAQFFEQTALGLIETVTFKEIGSIDAKVDSGNGAFNVLHGIVRKPQRLNSFHGNESNVSFETVNGIKLTKPIQKYIDINIGSGNVEKRPVVLFDIQIGGQSYPNTPFSLADRANNEQKVLIGKDFIEKLGGLIDVSTNHNLS